jgi:hypothetical protein
MAMVIVLAMVVKAMDAILAMTKMRKNGNL